MVLFDGRLHASILDTKISNFLASNAIEKKLLIIQIGDNASSEKYVNLKKKVCESLGINVALEKLSDELSDEILYQKISDLVKDDILGGVIIQLPLPRESLQNVLNLIPSNKDVDMLSSTNINQFYEGNFKLLSPVVRAFNYFVENNDLKLQNMTTCVIGGGDLVGKPLSFFLSKQGAKVQVLDKKNKYDKSYVEGQKLECNLLITSTGTPNLIKGKDISENCYVVDFGSSVVDAKTVGDIDINSGIEHIGIFSPSPGGMGPLVVRFLIINFLEFVTGKKVL